jgi:hypothetical protein
MREYRLRVCENRVLRIEFEPNRVKAGGYKWLHNKELHKFLVSPNILV